MLIAIVALVSFAVGAFGGYKYGHSVATKAAAEAQNLRNVGAAVKKAL